jgi:Cytochrome C oxidase, cbb3-type, subunit III
MISTKTKFLSAASLLLLFVLAGCRTDMQDQPKFIPLRKSDFYTDERSSRPVLAGTVARGQLRDDTYFYTGKMGNADGTVMPFPVTRQVLARGQERFNIYCAPCHSEVGDGNGMIVQRGYRRPPSYHIDRLRQAPVGHFFDVITNGFGAMPDYSAQVQPGDRWAIIAYIRALQLSQNAPANSAAAGDYKPPIIKGAVPTGAVQPTFEKPGEKGGEHE